MRKMGLFFGVMLLFAVLFWGLFAKDSPLVMPRNADAQTLLEHRFAGENTTRRAEAKYPQASDIVSRLGLTAEALDEMSLAGNNAALDRYSINIQVDVQNKTAQAQQTLLVTNHTGYVQKELYFHIYPNAQRSRDTAPVMLDLESSYPNGFSPGELQITALRLEGQEQPPSYEVIGETASVLKVVLAEPWAEGQSLTLFIDYRLKLPETLERFGQFDGFFNFAHFYPILAVFDDSGWNIDPYTGTGDPFYSDIADYEVKVTIERTYEVASSARLLERMVDGSKYTYHFKGTNLRSFCFVAYDGWHKGTTRVGSTELISYVRDPEKAAPFIEAASGMLTALQDYLGPYPYPTLSFVESAHISAMEWPGLIIIPTHAMADSSSKNWALEACAHEVSHQYFYGLVGNDQVDEAWLDEGFATYLNYVWHPLWGAFNAEQNAQTMQSFLKAASYYKDYEGVLVKPIRQFTADDPYWNIYDAGALFLNKMRLYLGDSSFDQGLRTYFERYKYKLADTDEFFRVMEEVSGKELQDFVRTHLKYELKP